jgi:hypothetical protein
LTNFPNQSIGFGIGGTAAAATTGFETDSADDDDTDDIKQRSGETVSAAVFYSALFT